MSREYIIPDVYKRQTGTTQNDVAKFYGDKDVLPEDGTQVTVVFRLAK